MLRQLFTGVANNVIARTSVRPFVRGYYHILISGWGANYLDVDNTLHHVRSADEREWGRAWGVTAQKYLDQALEKELQGRTATAAELFKRAALYFHIGDIALAAYSKQKQELYAASAGAYRRYAELTQPPVERIIVPYKGKNITGYLHLPAGRAPFACVVIVPGLASAKEQPDFPPDLVVARGMAAFHMDMPGHGETYPDLLLDFDSFASVSAAIDVLTRHPQLDSTRLALLGTSLGATIALRAASVDDRVAAVTSVSGFYEPNSWFEASARLTEPALRVVTGKDSHSAVRDLVRSFTLRGHVRNIRCPLLAVHGDKDVIIPADETKQIYAEATAEKALIIYAGGDHGVCNTPTASLDILDWVAQRLQLAVAPAKAAV